MGEHRTQISNQLSPEADIGFKIMILGRLEGGRRTRRTLTTDNASKIFILKSIVVVLGYPLSPANSITHTWPALSVSKYLSAFYPPYNHMVKYTRSN
jgi:hypothetical protein